MSFEMILSHLPSDVCPPSFPPLQVVMSVFKLAELLMGASPAGAVASVRSYAVYAASVPEVRSRLLGALEDPDPRVRRAAEEALSGAGSGSPDVTIP